MVKDLEKLKDNLFDYIEKCKISVFYGLVEQNEEDKQAKVVYWDNEDCIGFFEVANNLGVDLLYYEEMAEGEIDNFDNPEDKLAQLIFRFIYGDITHNLVILSDRLIHHQEEERIKEQNSILAELSKPPVPDGSLCKRCKTEHKHPLDKDYCLKCIDELKNDADEKMEQFAKELSQDTEFKSLPNENARRLYTENKYRQENKNNKFIFLKKLSKDGYALSKM